VIWYVYSETSSISKYTRHEYRIPTTQGKQEKSLENFPSQKIQGISKFRKIQGKHREFLYLGAKFRL
jgi:hypothetical protein